MEEIIKSPDENSRQLVIEPQEDNSFVDKAKSRPKPQDEELVDLRRRLRAEEWKGRGIAATYGALIVLSSYLFVIHPNWLYGLALLDLVADRPWAHHKNLMINQRQLKRQISDKLCSV